MAGSRVLRTIPHCVFRRSRIPVAPSTLYAYLIICNARAIKPSSAFGRKPSALCFCGYFRPHANARVLHPLACPNMRPWPLAKRVKRPPMRFRGEYTQLLTAERVYYGKLGALEASIPSCVSRSKSKHANRSRTDCCHNGETGGRSPQRRKYGK